MVNGENNKKQKKEKKAKQHKDKKKNHYTTSATTYIQKHFSKIQCKPTSLRESGLVW